MRVPFVPPFQGSFLSRYDPRALPWAGLFRAFGPPDGVFPVLGPQDRVLWVFGLPVGLFRVFGNLRCDSLVKVHCRC